MSAETLAVTLARLPQRADWDLYSGMALADALDPAARRASSADANDTARRGRTSPDTILDTKRRIHRSHNTHSYSSPNTAGYSSAKWKCSAATVLNGSFREAISIY
jgi:hypothetical protein